MFNEAQWPVSLQPRRADFFLENQSRSGGISILGNEQVTLAPSGRWRARLTMGIVDERAILAWRAFTAGMSGRAGTAMVPAFTPFNARDENGRRFNGEPTALWGDDYCEEGVSFDLTGFGQDDTPVHAELAVPALMNATTIYVNYATGIDGVRPGQYFSIGTRMHVVAQTWQEDEGDPVAIRFTPWLREAAGSGTKVEIDKPALKMRFAQDITGDLELDLGRWGTGQIEMTEAW